LPIFSPGTGQVVAAGIDVLGGALQTAANFEAQSRAQDFSAKQYQQRYQITMADMRAAGLNPILAYQQGVGQSPRGTGASISPVLGGAAATARGASKLLSEVKLLKETRYRTMAEARAAAHRGDVNIEMAKKLRLDQEVSSATAASIRLQTKLSKTGLVAAEHQEALDKMPVGKYLRWINRAVRAVQARDQTGARR